MNAAPAEPIALLISDVDGTLVGPDKQATPATIAAVRALHEAGVGFTLISSRPPRGMAHLVDQLGVALPFAAFNGGSLAIREKNVSELNIVESHRLDAAVARRALDLLARGGVDAWVFADGDWRLRDPGAFNVPREKLTVGFDPTVVTDFDDVIGRIDKIVGVSADAARMARVDADMRAALGVEATIILSQPVYLDITHPLANKGDGVAALCRHIGVDLARTTVIGDMFNDVAMFARAGFSIAMGQAPDAVKARASAATAANTEDGFAAAVDRLILPTAGRP